MTSSYIAIILITLQTTLYYRYVVIHIIYYFGNCCYRTSDPIKFKHPPSLPAKSKATAATNYSKRLAASKALKQNKTGALPATLLKMK